jgi:hypothetical protein
MSDEKNFDHLLSKHGILSKFSVARRVDDVAIQELTNKIKAISKNKIDFNNKLRLEIAKKTKDAILRGQIPGLILNIPKEVENSEIPSQTSKSDKPMEKSENRRIIYNIDKLKLSIIYDLVSSFNKTSLINEFTKDDICFSIFTILNFLEVNDDDFKKFHEKYRKKESGDDARES